MKDFAAIVVGGGPAGSATALALARSGASVLLLERSRYEGWRAGETLPPDSRAILGKLGVWDRFPVESHLPSRAIHSAWGSADILETDFIWNPYGKGWHLDRSRFDAWLAGEAALAGATVMLGVRAEIVRSAGSWHVQVAGETGFAARAPWLVDATGRSSRIAVSQGNTRLAYDRLAGMAGFFIPEPGHALTEPLLLLEATEEGWWYSVPLPDRTLLVTYMTDLDYIGRSGLPRSVFWEVKLGRTRQTLARTRGFWRAGQIRARAAGSSRLAAAAGPGWLAVGDAASTHDPLAADGVMKALDEGLRAARAIQNPSDGPADYANQMAIDFEQYLKLRTGYYSREQRWPTSHFWKRRQTAYARSAASGERS